MKLAEVPWLHLYFCLLHLTSEFICFVFIFRLLCKQLENLETKLLNPRSEAP